MLRLVQALGVGGGRAWPFYLDSHPSSHCEQCGAHPHPQHEHTFPIPQGTLPWRAAGPSTPGKEQWNSSRPPRVPGLPSFPVINGGATSQLLLKMLHPWAWASLGSMRGPRSRTQGPRKAQRRDPCWSTDPRSSALPGFLPMWSFALHSAGEELSVRKDRIFPRHFGWGCLGEVRRVMDSRLPTLRALYISPAPRNQGHRSSFPWGLAPPSPTLPGFASAAPNLHSLFLLALGEKRSNELKIISGFLHPVHSNLFILSFIFPHCTLGDFCSPEGSLVFLPHRSCGRSPTDALWSDASRKVPTSAGARGHAAVFLRPRLTSSPYISCHHFIHSCIKPAPPAPPGAAPPPSAAPRRRGAERTGARRRRAELSGCPRSLRLGNWAVGEAAKAGLYRSARWWFETLSASLATRRRRERGAGARRGAGRRDEALPALSASARGTHGARTRSLTWCGRKGVNMNAPLGGIWLWLPLLLTWLTPEVSSSWW